ncbi:hypothetical protein EJ06DRAFT_532600 [Trichodelitschia bisporula]|uniref:Uncharacterized protein n=1 Tax=Trichodelitschia bisporula TaxID=703511 RepID=A0A6G1HQR2_9PEZI|nr:hypothetical protein EJ06DRAFT_532600 [Trichodelitschia bisporula]
MVVHEISTRAQVVGLKAAGITNVEIHRLTGVPARTINLMYARAQRRGFNPEVTPAIVLDSHVRDAPRSGRPRKNPKPEDGNPADPANPTAGPTDGALPAVDDPSRDESPLSQTEAAVATHLQAAVAAETLQQDARAAGAQSGVGAQLPRPLLPGITSANHQGQGQSGPYYSGIANMSLVDPQLRNLPPTYPAFPYQQPQQQHPQQQQQQQQQQQPQQPQQQPPTEGS